MERSSHTHADTSPATDHATADIGAILPGVLVGHATLAERPTGVTVVLLPDDSTVGVDVRGAAPGTHETDLLDPVNTIDVAHAIVLSGGSAFGLATTAGVMGWLEDQGRGIPVGPARVPIVPAAVVFDLLVGDPSIRPDAGSGRRACEAAVPFASAQQGSVGAGAGATVGKLLGPVRAMRGGLGIAHMKVGDVTLGAVMVVNAVGDVVDPGTGEIVAGARSAASGSTPVGAAGLLLQPLGSDGGDSAEDLARYDPPTVGASTTIGVLITDARLTKAQATRLAQVAHDGLARTIHPVHTPLDGDTIFVAGTGSATQHADSTSTKDEGSRPQAAGPDLLVLSIMAAEVTQRAVLNAIRSVDGLSIGGVRIPAWRDRPDISAV